MVTLLMCPFCGGKAERIDIEEGDNAGGSCICCTICQASGNIEFGRKENFVSNWNRRTVLKPTPRQIEAAIEAYREGTYLNDEQVFASVSRIVRAALSEGAQ